MYTVGDLSFDLTDLDRFDIRLHLDDGSVEVTLADGVTLEVIEQHELPGS